MSQIEEEKRKDIVNELGLFRLPINFVKHHKLAESLMNDLELVEFKNQEEKEEKEKKEKKKRENK